jgi:diguanylate cyclase (GGDEF)-like protein/PAS domain S-box-containing protein
MPRSPLLVLTDAADAKLALRCFVHECGADFQVQWMSHCRDGVERLRDRGQEAVAGIVLDLALPDSRGIESFERVFGAASQIPILVLGRHGDEELARQAVRRGAQDYLLLEHLDGHSLPKALNGMIDRSAHAQALGVEREHAQMMLNSIGDAVISTDISGNVTYLNPVAENMTGWSSQEASGRPLQQVLRIVDADSREPPLDPLAMAILYDKAAGLSANYVLISRDGHESAIEDTAAPIHDRQGSVIGGVIVFHDVGVARAMSVKMSYLAQHDSLTQLPNRMLLHDRLTQAIAAARRHRQSLAVLFLDVDRFKHTNDSLGHAVGDQLLQSIARRLVTCVRKSDTVSRLGGDEFVILLSEVSGAADAAGTAQKILAAMSAPHRIEQHELRVRRAR